MIDSARVVCASTPASSNPRTATAEQVMASIPKMVRISRNQTNGLCRLNEPGVKAFQAIVDCTTVNAVIGAS